MPPFTVYALTVPPRPSASTSPFTVLAYSSRLAGSRTVKSTVTSLFSVFALQWSPGSQVFSCRARRPVGYRAQIVTPASEGTTLISTSAGSLRRACFTAVTSIWSPVAATAWMSPLTPLISSRFPAARWPVQRKSCPAAGATRAARASAARAKLLLVVVVTVVILVFGDAAALRLAGLSQLDVPVERFQLHLGTARPEGNGETVPGRHTGELHREARLEVAVQGRDRHAGVGAGGDRDVHVAVVGGQPVAAGVPQRALVGDVAVDGAGVHGGGLDPRQLDVAVHRLGVDVAVAPTHRDALVDRADFDTTAAALQCHLAFDRLERDVAAPTRHGDLALDGLRADLRLHARHLDVRVEPGERERHAFGDGDVVLHRLRHAAPARGLHGDHLPVGGHLDAIPARVLGVQPHLAPVPGPHGDLPAEVVDLEPAARPNGEGRVGLLQGGQGREGQGRDEHLSPPRSAA